MVDLLLVEHASLFLMMPVQIYYAKKQWPWIFAENLPYCVQHEDTTTRIII